MLDLRPRISQLYRDESGRILATLIRALGDFDLAEDVLQEAFAAALDQWPRDGVPDSPRAWLTSTARNKAVDHNRRRRAFADRREALEALEALRADEQTRPDSDENPPWVPDREPTPTSTSADPASRSVSSRSEALATARDPMRLLGDDRLRLIFTCCHP